MPKNGTHRDLYVCGRKKPEWPHKRKNTYLIKSAAVNSNMGTKFGESDFMLRKRDEFFLHIKSVSNKSLPIFIVDKPSQSFNKKKWGWIIFYWHMIGMASIKNDGGFIP